MANAIATVTGTGLRPGVSKNRRYYQPEVIAKAVARAQARLADPDGRPITMRVAHPDPETAAWAPVTEICGALASIRVASDGSVKFGGRLSGNQAGRDVLALVDTRGKTPPFLKNVSIRGRWLGEVRTVLVEGQQCETADDLEIDGIDYTHLPGVDGAQIDKVMGPGGALESAGARRAYVYESCEEALVTATEETTSAPPAVQITETSQTGPVVQTWADPGYLPDRTARYPLDTKAQVKAAWRALTESETAGKYTSAQLKRSKGRVKKAAGLHGVTVTQEGWLVDVTQLTESAVAEMWRGDDFSSPSFSANIDNGVVNVSVSSYRVDAHDLDRIARKAMDGAVAALASLDPDMDGDIDVGATEGAMPPQFAKFAKKKAGADDETDTTEALPPKLVKPNTDDECAETAATQTPASTEDAVTTTTESEVPAMAETPSTTASAAPAGTITLTQESLAQLVATAAGSVVEAFEAKRAAKKAAKAAAAGTPAPVVTETATPAPAAAVVEAVAVAATPVPAAVVAPAAAVPAVAGVVETEDQRIDRIVGERLTAALQGQVARGAVAPFRKGLVGKVNESGDLTPLGAGDSELNAHGLPRSWAGESAPHELKGAARNHLSASLMQHVVGHRI